MINRLSETLPSIRAAAEEEGWETSSGVRPPLRVLAQGREHTIDVKEHTGPVYWPNLSDWIARCGEGNSILMTMGFVPDRVLGQFLVERDLVERVALVWMGLTSFFETAFRPRKIGQTDTPVFAVVESVLAARGLQLEPVSCRYCTGQPLGSCQICGAVSCKSHFILCPLCQVYLCHPDVKDCYFKHEC